MTARWPSNVVAMLFALLAVATSASAECAWVLWTQQGSREGTRFINHDWEPTASYQSLDQCDARIRHHLTIDGVVGGKKEFPDGSMFLVVQDVVLFYVLL